MTPPISGRSSWPRLHTNGELRSTPKLVAPPPKGRRFCPKEPEAEAPPSPGPSASVRAPSSGARLFTCSGLGCRGVQAQPRAGAGGRPVPAASLPGSQPDGAAHPARDRDGAARAGPGRRGHSPGARGPGPLGRLLPGRRRGAGPRWAGAGAPGGRGWGAADWPADGGGRGAGNAAEQGVV